MKSKILTTATSLLVGALLATPAWQALAKPKAGTEETYTLAGNESVMVFADNVDANKFWYMPSRLRLVEKSARPLLSLVTYQYNTAADATKSKGLIQMSMTAKLPAAQLTALQKAIETKKSKRNIKLAGIRPDSATVRIYSDAGELISDGDKPIAIHGGANSLDADLPFSVPLSEVGTMVYEAMLIGANGGPIVEVYFPFKMQAEGFIITGSFNVDVFMSHKSSDTKLKVEACAAFMGFGASASVQGQWSNVKDRMEKAGWLKFDCNGDVSASQCNQMMSTFVKNAYTEMARIVLPPKVSPAQARDPNASVDCGAFGAEASVGVSWASKKEQFKASQAFSMKLTGSTPFTSYGAVSGQASLRNYLKVEGKPANLQDALIKQAYSDAYYLTVGPGPFTTAMVMFPEMDTLIKGSLQVDVLSGGQTKATKSARFSDGLWTTATGQSVAAYSFPLNTILGPGKKGSTVQVKYTVQAQYGSPAVSVNYTGIKNIALTGNGGLSGQDLSVPSAVEGLATVRVDGGLLSFRKIDTGSPLELVNVDVTFAGKRTIRSTIKPINRDGEWQQPSEPMVAWAPAAEGTNIKVTVTFKRTDGSTEVREYTAVPGEVINLTDADHGYNPI